MEDAATRAPSIVFDRVDLEFDGKPLFAFEVDAFRDPDDADIARSAAEKNRMLKSADIRLIRLKGALPNWPPAEILRMRLLAAQRTPAADMRDQQVAFRGSGVGRPQLLDRPAAGREPNFRSPTSSGHSNSI
mgnify:CR=1 FL=1